MVRAWATAPRATGAGGAGVSAAYDDVLVELLALRAQADRAIDRVRELAAAPPPPDPTPLYWTPAEFAARRRVHVSTVRAWLRLGLPHVGSGRSIRIKVAEADGWSADEALRRKALIAAQCGGR